MCVATSRSAVGNGRKGNVLLGCKTKLLYMSSVAVYVV